MRTHTLAQKRREKCKRLATKYGIAKESKSKDALTNVGRSLLQLYLYV